VKYSSSGGGRRRIFLVSWALLAEPSEADGTLVSLVLWQCGLWTLEGCTSHCIPRPIGANSALVPAWLPRNVTVCARTRTVTVLEPVAFLSSIVVRVRPCSIMFSTYGGGIIGTEYCVDTFARITAPNESYPSPPHHRRFKGFSPACCNFAPNVTSRHFCPLNLVDASSSLPAQKEFRNGETPR
jgi:hypothetical protein